MVRFLVDHPSSVYMTLLAILLMAVYALISIPVTLLPSSRMSVILISSDCPGYDALSVEQNVTALLQKEFAALEGLGEINGTSVAGNSRLLLRLEPGFDADLAVMEIQSRLDRLVTLLPADVARPVVMKSSVSDIPVFQVHICHKNTDRDSVPGCFYDLSEYSSRVVKSRLEQLDEVSLVEIAGAYESYLEAVPDMELLNSIGLAPEEVHQQLLNHGSPKRRISLQEGNYSLAVEMANSPSNADDPGKYIIARTGGSNIALGQIFDIRRVFKPVSGYSMINGKRALSFRIYQRGNSRTAQMKRNVIQVLEEALLENPEMDYIITYDQAEVLKGSVRGLWISLLFALLLSSVFLILFMHDLRSSMILILTIPTAVLVTVLMCFLAGLSMNMITLFGLILCIGMMTDNALIISENIFQKISSSEGLKEGIVTGTNEVIRPLLTSTLTTCVVFLPLFIISGLAGELFFEMAIVVVIGIVVSFLVGISLLPVFYSSLFKGKAFPRFTETKLILWYVHSERYLFKRSGYFMVFFTLMALLSLLFLPQLPVSTLPYTEPGEFGCLITWADKVSLEENLHRTKEITEKIEHQARNIIAMIGPQGFLLSDEVLLDQGTALIYFVTDEGEAILRSLATLGSSLSENYHVTFETFAMQNIFEKVFSSGQAPLEAIFPGSRFRDPENAALLSSLLSDAGYELSGTALPFLDIVHRYVVLIDEDMLRAYNISQLELVEKIKALAIERRMEWNRTTVDRDILVFRNCSPDFLSSLEKSMIRSSEGFPVPLSTLVTVYSDKELRKLETGRYGPMIKIPLHVNNIETAVEKISNLASGRNIPVYFTGDHFRGKKVRNEILYSMIMVVVLLYFILAAQFESLIQPFIVLSELLIDLSGAFALLILAGQTMNLISGTGILIMSGIVINDSILKVDVYNRLIAEGRELEHALTEGGKRRIRPILMTSLTTILSVLPLLWAKGLGAELQYSFALALIGGLTIGTLASLYFVPLFYRYIYRKRNLQGCPIRPSG